MVNCNPSDDDPTTVELKFGTKKRLDKLKIIDRESYDQVVNRLISNSGGTNSPMITEALGSGKR